MVLSSGKQAMEAFHFFLKKRREWYYADFKANKRGDIRFCDYYRYTLAI